MIMLDQPEPVTEGMRTDTWRGVDISHLNRKELEIAYRSIMQAYLHEVDENIMLFNNLTALVRRPWWKFWRPK